MSEQKKPSLEFVKKGKSSDAKVLPDAQVDRLKGEELEDVSGGFDPPYECMCGTYGNE